MPTVAMPTALRGWFMRLLNQNVMGFAPAPLGIDTFKEAIQWDKYTDPAVREARSKSLDVSFAAEQWLMAQAFAKLIGLLALFGFIFAFGLSNPAFITPFAKPIIIGGIVVSLILLVWALAPRWKVMRRQPDWGMTAITDITDAQLTPLYAKYKWHWNRQHSRVAIDRMTLAICFTCNITLSLILISGAVTVASRIVSAI